MVIQDIKHELFDFDYNDVEKDGLNVVLGSRDSGKSSITRYMAQRSMHARKGVFIVITGSSKVRRAWAKIVPRKNIHQPSLRLLRKLKQKQNDLIEEYDLKGKEFPEDLHLSIYMDDCGSDGKFMRSLEVNELATYGRQWETDVTVILHDFCQVCPEFRKQVDNWVLMSSFDEDTIKAIKKLCVHKASVRELIGIIDFCTPEKGEGVVIRKNGKPSILDRCFKIRVPIDALNDCTPLGGPHFLKHDRKFAKNVGLKIEEGPGSDEDEEKTKVPVAPQKPMEELIQEDKFGRLIIRCLGKTRAQAAMAMVDTEIKPKHKQD